MVCMLIAEDQDWTRKGLLEMIERKRLGITEILEAENGFEALQLMNKKDIDILLTDIRMPGMDGLQLSRSVKLQFPDTKVVILSGFNEFSYAQEALRNDVRDYLLKPVLPDELNNALETAIESIQSTKQHEQVFYQMILKQLLETSPIFEIDSSSLFIDQFGTKWKRIMRITDNNSIIDEETIQTLRQSLRTRNIQSIALRQHKEWILFLTSVHPFEIYELIDSITTIEADNPVLFANCIGFSGLYQNLQDTWLKELESILAVYNDMKKTAVCEFRLSNTPELHTSDSILNLLTQAIENHNMVLLHKWLQQVFPDQAENAEIARTCFSLILLFRSHSQEDTEWNRNTDFLLKPLQQAIRLSSSSAYRSLNEWLKESIRNALEIAMMNREKKDIQLIQWCQSYILNNLNGDVSLSSLGKKLHFSPSHLSNLFKQLTNQNYIDFVTDLKINKAKYYLTETELRVQDIANNLGYIDTRYFSKLFRRLVGLTPSEFKQQNQEEKSG